MLTTAMAHQEKAFNKLSPLKVGAIFGEMGTGKTRIFAELALSKVKEDKASRAVILCPVSGMSHIANEVKKHTGIDAHIHHGAYSKQPSMINIIGIESMSSSISALNKLEVLCRDAAVIIDESQLIKNRSANRTERITRITRSISKYRYISSGLPNPNGVEDLWTQLSWLSPLILGYKSYGEFKQYHLKHSGDWMGHNGHGRVCGRFNTDVIAAKIAPYSFDVRKKDCLDLPPKTYGFLESPLDDESMAAYNEAKTRILFGRDAFDVDDASIYRLFTALQLISSGILPNWLFKENEYTLTSPKDEMLKQALMSSSGKRIVWCKYKAEVDRAVSICNSLGLKTSCIHGDIPLKSRGDEESAFLDGGDALVSTINTGALVKDWGFADYAIYMSNSFDYMQRAQSEDRTHRAFMTGKAHYIDLKVSCGIEKMISKSLKRKEDALKAFQNKIRELRIKNDRIEASRILGAL